MTTTELIKMLIDCIYKRDGHDVVSVAKLKNIINILENKGSPRYHKIETTKRRF